MTTDTRLLAWRAAWRAYTIASHDWTAQVGQLHQLLDREVGEHERGESATTLLRTGCIVAAQCARVDLARRLMDDEGQRLSLADSGRCAWIGERWHDANTEER